MTARLTSAMLVSAMIRRVAAKGGNVVVVARGDPTSGAVLLICMEKNVVRSVIERVLDHTAGYVWTHVFDGDEPSREKYLARRRERDPDLWIVELDIANAERFAAEMSSPG